MSYKLLKLIPHYHALIYIQYSFFNKVIQSIENNQLVANIFNIIVAHAVRATKWFSKVTGWLRKCCNMLPRKETQQQLQVLRYNILWFFVECMWDVSLNVCDMF